MLNYNKNKQSNFIESDIMREPLFFASQELKRAEHLLYVSLKYTRTADVMQSFIARLVACFDFIIDGLLKKKRRNW